MTVPDALIGFAAIVIMFLGSYYVLFSAEAEIKRRKEKLESDKERRRTKRKSFLKNRRIIK